MLTNPTTRPCMSSTGPPLFPGSIGMASCSISRPFTSRLAETTPATTLCLKPSGFPNTTTAAPCGRAAESPSGSADQRLVPRRDFQHGQIESVIRRADRLDVELGPIDQFDREWQAFSNHVEIRGDQVRVDDEARPQTALPPSRPATVIVTSDGRLRSVSC